MRQITSPGIRVELIQKLTIRVPWKLFNSKAFISTANPGEIIPIIGQLVTGNVYKPLLLVQKDASLSR